MCPSASATFSARVPLLRRRRTRRTDCARRRSAACIARSSSSSSSATRASAAASFAHCCSSCARCRGPGSPDASGDGTRASTGGVVGSPSSGRSRRLNAVPGPVPVGSSKPYCSARTSERSEWDTQPSPTRISPSRRPVTAWSWSARSSVSSVRRPFSTSSRPRGRHGIRCASIAARVSAVRPAESTPERGRRAHVADPRQNARGEHARRASSWNHDSRRPRLRRRGRQASPRGERWRLRDRARDAGARARRLRARRTGGRPPAAARVRRGLRRPRRPRHARDRGRSGRAGRRLGSVRPCRRRSSLRRLRAAERARDLRQGAAVSGSEAAERELHLLDSYWRAANYLSVGQIYLLDNPLLRQPLEAEHVKPRLLGHFGTTPGLNFVYAHLNRAIKARDLSALYVTGPGHGGPGLVANAYLEGTYSELYPDVSEDEDGLRALFRQFSFPGGIPSHVAPETPGSIHEGGELGYALSYAFGAAFDNPELLVTCVVGDGEAETGPLATSWHSNKFLNPARDGAVLPILHLNGAKIVDGKKVEGTFRSHQVPLDDTRGNPEHLKLLEKWMKSYRPGELFDSSGRLKAEIASLSPKGDRRMGANPHANGGLLVRD